MAGLIFHAPPVAPLLAPSSSTNIRRYTYSSSSAKHVLPDLSGDVVPDARVPTTSGGITDVWKSTWFKDTGSTKVAVKTFRIESTSHVPEVLGMSYFRLSTSGAIRYAAPELFRTSNGGQVSLPSTFSDIYSLGTIIFLVLSGSPPYSTLTRDSDVLVELLLGVAPASPSDSDKSITRDQWQFMQRCWSPIPENRPSTNEALEFVDVNLALYIPFRAISLTATATHSSKSSKTDGSKPRHAAEFSGRFESLTQPSESRRAQAAVSVILNDIFDISHVVPQWDSKETENAVVSQAYNALVEDIKMISDALRVLQTSNPNAVERSLGPLRSTVEQLLFDDRRKPREPRDAFLMIMSKLQDFLDDLWSEVYGSRGNLSTPFWEWFEKWMAMMRAWDNSQTEAAAQNVAACLRSILS
ncbi:hypothetical protein AZE42_06641 [Rhizopogon vesiculosus]|uniref:Protein kinase domain-containing protein n=1 Tax=Rhizopogon vesiculosus TaxID=180088 RepID=A0A1J8QGL4_9AGAM|nr:hypothetical protein AZE42_06641 [Rhizopogon vesiculosus]